MNPNARVPKEGSMGNRNLQVTFFAISIITMFRGRDVFSKKGIKRSNVK